MKALIGDCGGTFSRFALLEEGVITPLVKLRNAEFSSFREVVKSLNRVTERAAICVAGAHHPRHIPFTNNGFVADSVELEALGFGEVTLMNDFVPISLSLSDLSSLNIQYIDEREAQTGNRLVLGAGTGLGVGALLSVGDKYMALPTEGGHMDLGATTPLEQAIWSHIDGHICAETLLSGSGFVKIYQALLSIQGLKPHDISSENLVSECDTNAQAQQAAKILWDILARFAGDLALLTLAKGGVYVTGGMCERLRKYVDKTSFRANFINKPPYQNWLNEMNLGLIGAKDPAFLGLKAFIERRERFCFI